MALSQMQIIQSLGEAMNWFQKEISWGVEPAELRHLCGRMGELYAALMTNGQMAQAVNQRGYDVVSKDGERISVKTTTMNYGEGHVTFNSNTLDLVDRVIVLRINTEDMQIEILLNAKVEDARDLMHGSGDKGPLVISLSKLLPTSKVPHEIQTIEDAQYNDLKIRELETGTIEVEQNGKSISPVKPQLRMIAQDLGIDVLNGNGNPHNTRQLGSIIIKSLKSQK